MPFRQRPEETPADSLDAARTEVERAKGAMTYWKLKQAEAIEQIASMDGVGGWIAGLTGQKKRYLEEAHSAFEHCKRQLIKERNALLTAQQQLDRHQQAADKKKRSDDEHLLDLELVAANLRTSDHPLAEQLGRLEDELDAIGNQVIAHQELVAVAGAIRSLLGALERNALRTQTRLLPTQGTLEASAARQKLPGAVRRLQAACVALGIEPIDIQVQDYVTGAMAAVDFNAAETARLQIQGERDMLAALQDHVGKERLQALERQTEVHAERRKLLESLA